MSCFHLALRVDVGLETIIETMQVSISTAVQLGAACSGFFVYSIQLLKGPSTLETFFNIIGFKLSLLSHRACFCLRICKICKMEVFEQLFARRTCYFILD